jgi:hypothetical protein
MASAEPAQPTENTLEKALKSPIQQDLGMLPVFAFRLSRPNETHSFGLPVGPFGSIEVGRANRVISPYCLEISPSGATAAFRIRGQPVRLNGN